MEKSNIENRTPKLNPNREYRQAKFECEGRVIEGYQIVFNSESEDLGFREIILPEQINMQVVNRCDIFALLDHDRSRPLARRRNGKGTLDISIDEKGLKYRFELANTQIANELYEYIQRGELDQSSFAFTCDHDEWQEMQDGSYLRTIHSIDELFDVSQVFQPAYSASEVGLRGLEDAKAKSLELKQKQERKIQEQKELQRKIELQKYYSELRRKISQI